MTNPFLPPNTRVADPERPTAPRGPAFVLAGAALLQLGLFALYAGAYWDLVWTGLKAPLIGIVSALSSLTLYVGTARFVATGRDGARTLLIAGIALALSALAWRLPLVWTSPFSVGSLIGFVGWWLVGRNRRRAGNPPRSA